MFIGTLARRNAALQAARISLALISRQHLARLPWLVVSPDRLRVYACRFAMSTR
tara:strand:- start:1435 stop:1596 length:162 start_codon:yes stop_codon:yes gene_type:complete